MPSLSVAVPKNLKVSLLEHLIRKDGQEDLTFALYSPSQGERRFTGLIHTVLWPREGEREVHGNVSFSSAYFQRALETAMKEGCGLAFMHSHPFSGWQGVSRDDVSAEQQMAGPCLGLLNLPLLGMTVGNDGFWSARFWQAGPEAEIGRWCESVRVVGENLQVYFCPHLSRTVKFDDATRRSRRVWSDEKHQEISKLRVGIVGLGSVGSQLVEHLARMGIGCLILLDFDHVKTHNLDRLLGASREDVGKLKIEVQARQARWAATHPDFRVHVVEGSVWEKNGYQTALDCDVLFSCVDRPKARQVLNHIAYGHLIPVIDGGIAVRFARDGFSTADWQTHTATPGMPCLECLGMYTNEDVSLDQTGMLDDPAYMQGLPESHPLKLSENVFTFSAHLGAMMSLQFMELLMGALGVKSLGAQRFRYFPGQIEQKETTCTPFCPYLEELLARGDQKFSLLGKDLTREKTQRERPQ